MFQYSLTERTVPVPVSVPEQVPEVLHSVPGKFNWRLECLTPLVLTPLVAARAFSPSDYWGLTGVARCAEEMRQESVGISNRLLTPATPDCEDLQGALSATLGLAKGGLGTHQFKRF